MRPTIQPLFASARTALLLTLSLLQWAATPAAPALMAAAPEVVLSIGEGVSAYRPADAAASREEALAAAQRNAVEQVSGVIIDSESATRNFSLVRDEVLSRSKGFVRKYHVTHEGQNGDLYTVRIEAEVVSAAFMREFDDALETLYRQVGKPRVMVVVKESSVDAAGRTRVGEAAKQRVAEREIRKFLMKSGLTFVDARAEQGASLLEVALQDGPEAREKLLGAARDAKAEILVLGQAVTHEKGARDSFYMANADLTVDVVRVDSGQVLASEVASGRGLAIHQDAAGTQAVQKAAMAVAPRMMEQVTYWWIKDNNEGGVIALTVKNASFDELTEFTQMVRIAAGVGQVRQKSFRDGEALLEIQTQRSASQLAEFLAESKYNRFRLEVESLSGKAFTVRLAGLGGGTAASGGAGGGGAGPLELRVKDVTFADLVALKQVLKGAMGLQALDQRSFSGTEAVLELGTGKSAVEFAEALHNAAFEGFRLDIHQVSANGLTVGLIKTNGTIPTGQRDPSQPVVETKLNAVSAPAPRDQ